MSFDPAAPMILDPAQRVAHELAGLSRRLAVLERTQHAVREWTEAWHDVGAPGEPAFENGFVNYGAGRAPCGFYRGTEGRVWLRGVAAQPNSDVIPLRLFTLPAGYRPEYHHEFVVAHTFADSIASYVIRVETDGSVRLDYNGPYFGAALPLDGIDFVAQPADGGGD